MKSKWRAIAWALLSTMLTLLSGIFCFKQWTAYRRNSKASKTPLQVWEGEGGQIPSVPTPSPTSTESAKENKIEDKD